ncbi:MAG: hypothetical protein K5681_03445 [Treponema sp.]|nr:hypothetical protein [Treponema sp.]
MTSTKRLIEKLQDNLVAKIVSLGIAILLYLFYHASQIDKKTIVVPLKIVEDGIVMHVGSVPNNISLVIRTNDTIMNMINPSDFEGVVDISYITEPGTYKLPVHINLSSKLMELDPLEVILKDEEIKISVDKRITKYVPLVPSIVGEVAHGYTINQVTISPSTVEIAGPESILNGIEGIPTTRIMVSNAENNFSVETSCQEQTKLVSILEDGPFTATVSLDTQLMEREFTNIKIDVLSLPEALTLTSELPSLNLVLSGDVPILENYTLKGRVAYINLKDISEAGTYELPVKISLPSSLQVISQTPESITLSLENVEETTENIENQENPENQEVSAEESEVE